MAWLQVTHTMLVESRRQPSGCVLPCSGVLCLEHLEQGLAFGFHSLPEVGTFVLGTSCTTEQNSLGLGHRTWAVPLA